MARRGEAEIAFLVRRGFWRLRSGAGGSRAVFLVVWFFCGAGNSVIL